ncbi:magnesium chelatase accessory protein [Litoreibacter ponti]|uniref:Magnesium chelatase accessory protein n=2 Tax=Litoreibacter ponti TaxID=1510457 RepID=A0A2T6BPE9_9RHOB|nr:magnesium chelatase accessory protein [Litoreibacter ponti]
MAQASRFVTARPHKWHVQEHGEGPRVLLIHGAGGSTHSWRKMFPRLAEDFQTLAVDLPGQGFSTLGNKSRCGLDHMAHDLAHLLDQLDFTPSAVIGHSAGAALMFRMALNQPDLANTRLISINGALENFRGIAGLLFPAMAKFLALNPLTAPLFAMTASSPDRVKSLIASTGSTLEPEGLAQYHKLISDRDHVEATLLMMAQWSLDGLLRDIPNLSQQVLFLAGENDKAVPPDTSLKAAKRIKNATCVTLPKLGHLMHEEDASGCLEHILPAL